MYYGHIKSGAVLLTGIVKKGRGYTVELLFRGTNKKCSKSLSEVVIMLNSIPDYQITEWFRGMLSPLSQEGNKLADVISADLRSGKCTICSKL